MDAWQSELARFRRLVAMLLAITLVSGALTNAPFRHAPAPIASERPAPLSGGPGAEDLRAAVREALAGTLPAVVQISTYDTKVLPGGQVLEAPLGEGSGVIYDAEGHILTNYHVIEGADRLDVMLPDGRLFQGERVGASPADDLAVVRIEGEGLPVAELGDSTALRRGEWVVAIGNALGLHGGPTITIGVVSGLGRSIPQPHWPAGPPPVLYDLVQTDAPINPGNSGGPLVNLFGQVVGINTLVTRESASGAPVQRISFAIGISAAKPVADELVETGWALPRFLGVAYTTLDAQQAARLGVAQTEGLLVRKITPTSPAAKAGILPGDVITAIDSVTMRDAWHLEAALADRQPGDRLLFTVVRQGKTVRIPVVGF